MTITNSPDISKLAAKVTFDISVASPQVILENQSLGANLGNVTYAFVVKSPSGSFIHEGNINTPDETGVWTDATLTDIWPRPFGQIEWSGAPYQFYMIAKDSLGNIYQTEPQYATICRPAGNTPSSTNTYGAASSNVEVKCQLAKVFFQDTTYVSYRGVSGTRVSSELRVIYPIDETLTIPTPFEIDNYSSALVPISYSSSNYQFAQTLIQDYDFGNETHVLIRYQALTRFSVWCNVSLEPLLCEVAKIVDSIQNGSCADATLAQQKLSLINGKLAIVFMGMMQPLIGVDVPAVIEQIQVIGGFTCNCCGSATGIIPANASPIDGYNFIFNKLGGDVDGYWSIVGSNITLNLGDVTYIVNVSEESPSDIQSAFEFLPSTSGDGFTKTYSLKVDGFQLAEDILTIITENTALTNMFNTIITNLGGDIPLLVDGSCLWTSTTNCNYVFTLYTLPLTGKVNMLSITVGGIVKPINFIFTMQTLPALEAKLNTLGVGNFVVQAENAQDISILVDNTSFNLSQISFQIPLGVVQVANAGVNCTSLETLTANEAVQRLINYLCELNDTQMTTVDDYEVCYIDPVTFTKKTVVVPGGSALNIFLTELLARSCDTTDAIISIKQLNCANIVSQFPSIVNQIQNTDYLLGVKGGFCARVSPMELAIRQLQLGAYNPEFVAAFCNIVALCNGGLICAPYTVYQVDVDLHSPADDLIDLVITYSHPAAISNIIRYARVDNIATPIYTTITGVVASPHTISDLEDGQYIVGITPVYADGRVCAEVTLLTDGCTGITSLSATIVETNFHVTYTAVSALPKILITIVYPNGGSANYIYTNNDSETVIIPIPSGVVGDFIITATPMCNENTRFMGTPTSPVVVSVGSANNSALTNDPTGANQLDYSITFTNLAGQQLVFMVDGYLDPGMSVPFFLANGFYTTIVFHCTEAGCSSAQLVTDSGTYIGVLTLGGTTVTFNNVTAQNGIFITLY